MKPKRTALLLSALLWAAGTNGRAGDMPGTQVNPALIYWQAFSQAPQLTPEEQHLFDNRSSAPLDARYEALAARYDSMFHSVRRGLESKQPLDWGLDLADGPYMLLPHLAKVKLVAQAAQFRSRILLERGKEHEAIQDLLDAMALGRQSANDGTLISKLVQIANDNIVGYCVAENYYAFSKVGAKELLDGIDASPAANTVSQCIGKGERAMASWFQRKLETIRAAHPGDEASILKEFRVLLTDVMSDNESQGDQGPERVEHFMQSANGSSDKLMADVKAMDTLYDEQQSIAALPADRFPAANKAFMEKVEASHNPFAKELLPALQKAREKEFRYQARLAMLRAALQFRIRGEEGLRSVRDPLGEGPFAVGRFAFQNVDRGFQLKSAYPETPEEVMIFVEKSGPPFMVLGPSAGKPVTQK